MEPIIINEVAQHYNVVLYGDAGLRLLEPVKNALLPYLMDFPYIGAPGAPIPVIAVTPTDTYDYLGLNLTRKEALAAMPGEIQSTMLCIWMTQLTKEKFLNHWIDCAMHQECMSPGGADRKAALCHDHRKYAMAATYSGEYIGCTHAQSVINILLYREFGAAGWKHAQCDARCNKAWAMKRFSIKTSPVLHSEYCAPDGEAVNRNSTRLGQNLGVHLFHKSGAGVHAAPSSETSLTCDHDSDQDCLGGIDVLPHSVMSLISINVSVRLRASRIARECRFSDLQRVHSEARSLAKGSVGTVSWKCKAWCGGNGDRLKALAATLFRAAAIGYDFHLDWTHPVPVGNFFVR